MGLLHFEDLPDPTLRLINMLINRVLQASLTHAILPTQTREHGD